MNEAISIDRLNEEHILLMDIAERMGTPGRPDYGYKALRGVLHVIRDMLQLPDVFHLSAQLPQFVRGVYFEGYNPQKSSVMMYNDELLKKFRERMGPRNGDYFEEYLQKNVPTKISKEDFLIKVSRQTELEHKVRPQTVLRAVLEVLHDQLSAGEISNIHSLISHDVHELIA